MDLTLRTDYERNIVGDWMMIMRRIMLVSMIRQKENKMQIIYMMKVLRTEDFQNKTNDHHHDSIF